MSTYFPFPETNQRVRFIFTGAPGSGKTTTANYLAKHSNCKVVEEAATRYINGNINARESSLALTHNIKELQVKDMKEDQGQGVAIFDRSLICSLVYDEHYKVEDDKYEIESGYFHPTVFLFEPPSENEYVQDSVRTQSFEEAKLLDEKFFQAYQRAGYDVRRIPWMPLQERAIKVFKETKLALDPQVIRRPLADLHHFGEGMNDEGGRIQECVKKGQIWGNLSVVLDRPLIDGEDFDALRKIKKEKGYEIKEEALDHFNEKQVSLAYASILRYYVSQGRKIVSKSSEEPVSIFLHSFRGGDGPGHLKLLESLLNLACKGFELDSPFRYVNREQNVHIVFSFGLAAENPEKCVYSTLKNTIKEMDIVLTFSSHVGLKPEWKCGTLTIPYQWTPIDLKTMEIQKHQKYDGENHLLTVIEEVLGDQDDLVERINKLVLKNPVKKDLMARPLQKEDFHPAHFLDLGGPIFMPKEVNSHFSIVGH